ncbi:urocanate hydratase [candidate division KSB1 bacterium]|nr:urocanate hydratase [candidate division KSB1 bacterium]
MSRPMFEEFRPEGPIKAPRGTKLSCKNWDTEAALRMLMNNLDPQVALQPEDLVVYGGSGRAARNWKAYTQIVDILKKLDDHHTLCVQSGKPVYIAPTHPDAPRVILANSNIVPKWATQEQFDIYDEMGLMMYGQMTAGSWIYIATQGIIQGTYETFAAVGRQEFNSDTLKGRFILTAGMGGMSGAQPLAGTMNEAVILTIEARPERIARKVREGYCDRMTADVEDAIRWVRDAQAHKRSLSVGLVGNAGEVYPWLVQHGEVPDIVTDQTSAHNLLDYMPIGNLQEIDTLREKDPKAYKKRALETIAKHTEAILDMQESGAVAFDYGNNLRAQAELAGLSIRDENGSFKYPGFVPAYVRPLFCEGRGPFRWAALSGETSDIDRLDTLVLDMFKDNESLCRWIHLAREKIPHLGLPARVCWLGYGERAEFALAMNDLIRKGEIKAPIVIGRDHLDCGSVASPNRETEGMLDGSDAIADWPLLNFALNAVNGASWVSFHHGGGVGIGYSLHAGMVIVADGTKERDARLERVMTVDPGLGIARHADAGYEKAIEMANQYNISLNKL